MYTGTAPRMLDQPWQRGCATYSAVQGFTDLVLQNGRYLVNCSGNPYQNDPTYQEVSWRQSDWVFCAYLTLLIKFGQFCLLAMTIKMVMMEKMRTKKRERYWVKFRCLVILASNVNLKVGKWMERRRWISFKFFFDLNKVKLAWRKNLILKRKISDFVTERFWFGFLFFFCAFQA